VFAQLDERLEPSEKSFRSDAPVYAKRRSRTLLCVPANTSDQIRGKDTKPARVNEIAGKARQPATRSLAWPAGKGTVEANTGVSPWSPELDRSEAERTNTSARSGCDTQPNAQGVWSFRCLLLLCASRRDAEHCRHTDSRCEHSAAENERGASHIILFLIVVALARDWTPEGESQLPTPLGILTWAPELKPATPF
jgi:hypothetical protein